jgi:hypothetical protein
MNASREIGQSNFAAHQTVRKQMLMICPSSAVTTAGSATSIPSLELKVSGSLVYRKFHLAVVPVGWRYNANDGFEIQVDWITNNSVSSQQGFWYGKEPAGLAYASNGLFELTDKGLSFLPAFGIVRQTNIKDDFSESTLDPLDLLRMGGGMVPFSPDAMLWGHQSGTNDNSGAYLISTSPQKLVSDADTIRISILPYTNPWVMNSDGLTDSFLQVPFFVCAACVSNSLPY